LVEGGGMLMTQLFCFFGHPLASVSPDGTMMISVGDDNNIHLFKLNSNGHYELMQTMAGK
jgi:WD40 repeat protein